MAEPGTRMSQSSHFGWGVLKNEDNDVRLQKRMLIGCQSPDHVRHLAIANAGGRSASNSTNWFRWEAEAQRADHHRHTSIATGDHGAIFEGGRNSANGTLPMNSQVIL